MATTGQRDRQVVDVPEQHRYEIREEGDVVGFVQYRRKPGLVAFIHTEIDERREGEDLEYERVVPEGVEAMVPDRGPAEDVVYQLVGGLRSGLSYAGAATIPELWANAEFVRITAAGKQESGAHDVEVS